MPFQSTIYPGEKVIYTIGQVPQFVRGQFRGRQPRDFNEFPVGFSSYSVKYSKPNIPRDEWEDACEKMERNGKLPSRGAVGW